MVGATKTRIGSRPLGAAGPPRSTQITSVAARRNHDPKASSREFFSTLLSCSLSMSVDVRCGSAQ
jgi:hypothetical protein